MIREATASDLAAILELLNLLHEPNDAAARPLMSSEAEHVWQEMLSTPDRVVLVAESGGEIVGTLDLLVVPNLTSQGSPWAVVENMVVAARHRRQGIGRALFEEAVSRVKQRGGYKIQLLSRRDREEAHAFYTSLGLQATAVGFRLYLDSREGQDSSSRIAR